MMEPLATILYLSSSMRSLAENPSGEFPSILTDPPSAITLGSTSIELSSTSSSSTLCSDAYVNHISHDDVSGSPTVSCGLPSTNPPIFHSNEDIMEAMTTPEFPWEDMYHHAYFLLQKSHDQYDVESNDFISNEFDWFWNPIPAPDAFKEGNMANISPTIKINISDKPWIEENITLGVYWTQNKLRLTLSYSRNYVIFFPGPI